MSPNGTERTRRAAILVIAAVVLAGDVWLVRWRGGRALDQIAFALRILGLYGIVVGFLKSSSALARFGEVLEEMTSPNFFEFAAGNGRALAMLFGGVSIGFGRPMTPGPRARLAVLGQVLLVPASLFLVAYSAFHLLVIMPLAYVGYLAAGAIVQAIASSSTDIGLSTSGPPPQTVSLRKVVAEDAVAFRSYMVGVPSLLVSFGLELLKKPAA